MGCHLFEILERRLIGSQYRSGSMHVYSGLGNPAKYAAF